MLVVLQFPISKKKKSKEGCKNLNLSFAAMWLQTEIHGFETWQTC